MATIDELILRVTTDFKTQGITIGEAELRKFVASTSTADSAVKKLESSVDKAGRAFDLQNKKLNNAREAIVRSTAAFSGLSSSLGGVPGQILNVTNQIEQFEFVARRSGQSVDLFSASVGQATQSIGKLGVAGLVLASFMAGWKIGEKIAEFTGWGKAIENVADKLLNGAGATREQTQTLNDLNIKLQQSLWQKYGIEVDIAGKSVLEANKALLQVASSVNLANMAITKAMGELATASAKLSNDFILQQMGSGDKLVEIERRIGEARINMAKSISPKFVAIYKAEIEALQQLRASASGEYLSDLASEGKAAAAEAKRQAEERKRIQEKLIKDFQQMQAELTKATSLGAVIADPLGLVALQQTIRSLTPELEALSKEITEFENAAVNAGIGLGSMLESEQGLQILSTIISDIPPELQKVKIESDAIEKSLDKLAEGFAQLGAAIGGFVGDAIALLGSLPKAINAITDSIGKGIESIGKGGFTNIVSGIGSIVGAMGAAISIGKQLFEVFKNLFQHDWKADTNNILEAIRGIEGVSDSMKETIASLAEEIGDADTAVTLLLNDIMDDVGVTAETFDQFAAATRDVFSFLQRGQIDAAQATDILNGAFERLLAVGTDAFGQISPKLKEIIELSKQFGLEIPAITEFMEQQAVTLVDTFDSLVAGIADAKGAQGIADIFKTAFDALGGGPDAVAQMGDAITAIREKLKELGLTMADVGLGFLNQLSNINKKFPEQVSAINAVMQALVSLSNMGALTAGSFKTLQDQAMKAFDQINKDGKVSKAELETIRPLLALLANQALQYGFALSPATIELLKQAGLWDEVANKPKATGDATQTAMDRAATAMEKVAIALETIVENFNAAAVGATALGNAVNGIPTDLAINVALNVDDSKISKLGASGIPSYASGPPTLITTGGLANLDPGDRVIPPTNNGRPNAISGNNYITVHINGSNLSESALKRVAVQAVTEAMQKSGSLRDLRR